MLQYLLLKNKLTLDVRNSRLNPRVSKLERFEFWDVRIEASRVSRIEDPNPRS